ncbi:uncharacterized protein LOC132718572 [Ruditapes philippinarum]|uniref:uncharacterized protein LOC132718572 n=1 Tax=Ruditapes philippinarum TaxID=129788 RepID=UPI00295A91FB|nr:uncharacterized protein LOC132718572 [Ruditapes philippinarum]XP_060558268.1 uncharacterized protein LOC132718572 [Ruditapes philippinarum]XP_060558269.1 uncharacterized protein LOC132718572 [Ruditapes philippinarum]XP_060558271.1 uncharacterized protein LOC132718572 [Ruditapes philippinarum]
MSNSKKRKYDEQLNIPTDFRCIIHNSGLSNHGDCVTLNSTKLKVSAEQKLDQLHSIRNKRLAEPCDSPHRMHDICKSIPASLCGIDLNITGYHRGCYQAFTKNLDRLGKAECTKHSQKHHSPRIFANCSNQFPPECIFCKKLEVKPKKHANTERCVQFTNTTWQQIESQAFEVGDFALYRLVQGEDLVAREAMFHTSCRKDFELKVLVGKEAKQRFIAERLTHGASPIKFFDPIPKSKLKSMEASNKTVKLTAPQGKVIQYQEQSNIAFMLLVKAQSLNEQLDLEELMRFPLTPVPHSLGTRRL